MRSIRRRLLIGLLGTVGVVWAIMAITVYVEARHEVEEVFDAHLAQYARVLQALVDETREEGEHAATTIDDAFADRERPGHHYERKLQFQVWAPDGSVVLASHESLAGIRPPGHEGYGRTTLLGREWTTFSLLGEAPGELRVWVAEREDVRGETIGEIVWQQLGPGLLILPILALLIGVVVSRGLKPLQRVADEVAARSPDQLDPLDPAATPEEIRPLVVSLNSLFGRLRQAFERERRFVADAAHELRTPLAAIKAQAQSAIDARDWDEVQRSQALQNIVRGVDRATHLEAQLLTLARLDPEARRLTDARPVRLAALTREVLAELAPGAHARGVELSLESEHDPVVQADPELLAILLRNLVGNAIRHTRAGTEVSVSLQPRGEELAVQVQDHGPGIPQSERARVFERFYRGNGGAGSGLGLSIVKRVVELHGGRIELHAAEGGGLLVRVLLPAHRT